MAHICIGILIYLFWSQCASKDIHYSNHRVAFMLDSYWSICIIIPVTGSWDIESTLCLLHQEAVNYEFKVFILEGEPLQHLIAYFVSQILCFIVLIHHLRYMLLQDMLNFLLSLILQLPVECNFWSQIAHYFQYLIYQK